MATLRLIKIPIPPLQFTASCILDGFLYACPDRGSGLFVFDLEQQSVYIHDLSEYITAAQYAFLGICAFDGKVYLSPCRNKWLVIYNPQTKTTSGIDVSDIAPGETKFADMCAAEGRIYAAPNGASGLLVLDPSSGELSKIGLGKFGTMCLRGLCALRGKLYAAPFMSSKLLTYDLATCEMSDIDVSDFCVGEYDFACICECLGKVYAAPFNADRLLVFDPVTGQLSGVDISHIINPSLNRKFNGMCSLDNRIYALGYNRMICYDPCMDEVSAIDLHGSQGYCMPSVHQDSAALLSVGQHHILVYKPELRCTVLTLSLIREAIKIRLVCVNMAGSHLDTSNIDVYATPVHSVRNHIAFQLGIVPRSLILISPEGCKLKDETLIGDALGLCLGL